MNVVLDSSLDDDIKSNADTVVEAPRGLEDAQHEGDDQQGGGAQG